MPPDRDTPIQYLKSLIAQFASERDWNQFHSPKNLSMALAVETAELMEMFQWKTEQETIEVREDQSALKRVREEIADIAIYLLNLCNSLDIDLTEAVLTKMGRNARRYPVHLVKGKSVKYSDIASIVHVSERVLVSLFVDSLPAQQLELRFVPQAG